MPSTFLSPPQGPTQLRAPGLNEGADWIGNIAGNDPNAPGKIAQLLLKMREPLSVASMGMMGGAGMGAAGLPPGARSVGRESLAMLGSLMPQQRITGPRGWAREADLRTAVSPDAINQRVIPLLEAASTPSQPMYHPRVPETQQLAELAAQNARLQALLGQSKPAAPSPAQAGRESYWRTAELKRSNAPIDAGAILTGDEIKALMGVMRNTAPPVQEKGRASRALTKDDINTKISELDKKLESASPSEMSGISRALGRYRAMLKNLDSD